VRRTGLSRLSGADTGPGKTPRLTATCYQANPAGFYLPWSTHDALTCRDLSNVVNLGVHSAKPHEHHLH
jgi:hypothetical protein